MKLIKQFVERCDTLPFSSPDRGFPYSLYWRPAACLLLSGRIKSKYGGEPNMTDANRVCKDAKVNPHWLSQSALFLLKCGVIDADYNDYRKGKHFESFFGDDIEKTRSAAAEGFLGLVQKYTDPKAYRPSPASQSRLVEFLKLFWAGFQGRAVRADHIGPLLFQFTTLSEASLMEMARRLGLPADPRELRLYHWHYWLESDGQAAVIQALFAADWVHATDGIKATGVRKKEWIYLTRTGRVMLGLDSSPQTGRSLEFKALPNHCVFAGTDLPFKTLLPLFRYCKIKSINRIIEFQLDKKTLHSMPSKTSAGSELLAALAELEPLPGTIKALLADQPKVGGILRMRGCSGVVKLEDPATSDFIRSHGRLKGYLETGGPPGYLLIKSEANFHNFVERCRKYGFEVQPLA